MTNHFDFSYFDHFLDAVLITDTQGKLAYCNEAFVRIFELSPRKVKVGSEVFKQLPIQMDIESHKIEDLINGATPHREVSFTSSIGEENRVSYSLRGIQNDGQNFILFYIKDVSLENRLQQKYKHELKNKEDFIAKLDRKLKDTSFMQEITSLALQHETEGTILLDSIFHKFLENFKYLKFCLFYKFNNELSDFAVEFYLAADDFSNDKTRMVLKELDQLKGQLADADKQQKVQIQKIGFGDLLIVNVKGRLTDFGYFVFFGEDLNTQVATEDLPLIISAADQHGLSAENAILYVRSMTDEMTKLYNKRYFQYRFETEMIRHSRKELQFGIIMLDVDHFKKFNDTYGHATGDIVLKFVAEQMKLACRATDILARLGGEEFAVILVETDKEGAMVAAERLREKIEKTIVKTPDHGDLQVKASLGVSLYPNHGSNYDELLEMADRALYKAKATGRNRCVFYEAEEKTTEVTDQAKAKKIS